MKIFAVLPVSIALVGILFCATVRAAPPIPENFQIVAPDPSLPKELSAFFGKYEGVNGPVKYLVIVAQIDKQKATLHIWRDGTSGGAYFNGWETIKGEVIKERGEYQLWYRSRFATEGNSEAVLRGKYLQLTSTFGIVKLSRVSESAYSRPLPDDLKMVQPDPDLPRELSAFSGKWEGLGGNTDWFLIVEKIDEEKASVYLWANSSFKYMFPQGWNRCEALVTKFGGKYNLQFRDSYFNYRLTIKGQYLDMDAGRIGVRLRRVQ